MRTYVIGDIHGCNRTFNALLDSLALNKEDRLILLGDYIDRGPDSKGVIGTIFNLQEQGFEVVCLRGNHEQLLLNSFHSPAVQDLWLRNGGKEALASFGTTRLEEVPKPYIDFFNSTLFWYETNGYLCLHGGPDFSLADPLAKPEQLLWMRRWYDDIDYAWLGKRIILHGHTPVDITVIQEQLAKLPVQQYLNLDNGCVYAGSRLHGGNSLGCLAAFCLENRTLTLQTNAE